MKFNKNFLQNKINQIPANHKSIATSFDAIQTEHEISLDIIGKLPTWLDGTFIRNGPGKFNIGTNIITHWFDGFAFLSSFTFQNGKILYKSLFLKSDQFLDSMSSEKIKLIGFAKKYRALDTKHKTYDGQKTNTANANINIEEVKGHILALGETPLPIEFELNTLRTLGIFDYRDNLKKSNIWECAHLKRDPTNGLLYGFNIQYGWNSTYTIYYIDDSLQRVVLSSKNIGEPSYMHDFSITKNYIILTAYPLIVSGIDLLRPSLSFIGAHRWEPKNQTKIYIFDKKTGVLVSELSASPMFAFHHVNAYEVDNNQIIIYLLAGPNADLIMNTGYFLEKHIDHGLKKITINIKTSEVLVSQLSKEIYDLPRINDKFLTYKNKFFYAVWFNPFKSQSAGFGITKYNLKNNEVINWIETNNLAGEPIFIANPQGMDEDDGVLLSIVYDKSTAKSFLLILDGHTMKEIARSYIPNPIPLGLHGKFFNSK